MIIPHKILFHGWPTAVILEKHSAVQGEVTITFLEAVGEESMEGG